MDLSAIAIPGQVRLSNPNVGKRLRFDPDVNVLETQAEIFDTAEAAATFLTSEEFEENPIGTDFDAEEPINKIKQGEPENLLKKRIEIGQRSLPDEFF
ncbi:hypothetical protein H2200_013314 [Cladophialophora chaetospira]|uniref:Uncharacterized protein n=1 Tax=Cladophialophora chaetospira TaxID=386627 RepID=A0AA39CBA0_9EURO|nr:hypothetical protein H2200_013314 [Cladophialophora chaetospira]